MRRRAGSGGASADLMCKCARVSVCASCTPRLVSAGLGSNSGAENMHGSDAPPLSCVGRAGDPICHYDSYTIPATNDEAPAAIQGVPSRFDSLEATVVGQGCGDLVVVLKSMQGAQTSASAWQATTPLGSSAIQHDPTTSSRTCALRVRIWGKSDANDATCCEEADVNGLGNPDITM